MKLLVSGFEPFDGRGVNASQRLALALRNIPLAEIDLHTVILPVDHERGPQALLEAVQRIRPDTIICLGEAKGRMRFSIERLAVNLLDFSIPDNKGRQIIDEPIVTAGPAAYFVTLPVRAMLRAVQAAGVPAELSLSAGAFLCNQVSYALLHNLSEQRNPARAGFIHLPLLPEQSALEDKPVPSMALELMCKAMEAVISALVATTTDDSFNGVPR